MRTLDLVSVLQGSIQQAQAKWQFAFRRTVGSEKRPYHFGIEISLKKGSFALGAGSTGSRGVRHSIRGFTVS